MTGQATNPRHSAMAMKLDCPRCGAMAGSRCAILSRGELKHVRLHVQRLNLARTQLRHESRASLAKAFGS